MPTDFINADINFPDLSGREKSNDRKFEEVEDYLYQLLEQLRYTLSNLGQSNFNETEVETFKTELSETITEPINIRLTEDEANITELTVNVQGIGMRVGSEAGSAFLELVNPGGESSQISLTLGTSVGQSGSYLQLTSGGATLASTGAITIGTTGNQISLCEGGTQIASTGTLTLGANGATLVLSAGGSTLCSTGTLAITAANNQISLTENGTAITTLGEFTVSAATGYLTIGAGGATLATSGQLAFGTNGSSIVLKEGDTQICATGAISLSTSGGCFVLKDGNAQLAATQQITFGVSGSSITLKEGNTQIAATGAISLSTANGCFVIKDGNAQLAASGAITISAASGSIVMKEGNTQICSSEALTLAVSNSSGYSTISLKAGSTTIATSGNITLGGNVVFTSSLTDGTTQISGNNILTGIITGININGGLHASELYKTYSSSKYWYNRAEFDSGKVAFYYVGRTSQTIYGTMASKWQYGDLSVDYDNQRLWLRTTAYTSGALTVTPDLKIEAAGSLSIDADVTGGEIYIGNSYTETNNTITNNQTIILGKSSGITEANTRLTRLMIEGEIRSWNVFTSIAQNITDTNLHTYSYTGYVSGFVVVAYLAGLECLMSITVPIISLADASTSGHEVEFRIGTDASYVKFRFLLVSRPANMYGTGQISVKITARDSSDSKIARVYRIA